MRRGLAISCAIGLWSCTLLQSLDGFTGGSVDGGSDAGMNVSDATSEAAADVEARALCGGKDCLGGACIANACGPGVLAAGQTRARGLALFGDHVYWVTDAGAVMRVARSGGTPQVLATTGGKLVSIAVDATGVFFTNEGGGKVSQVPLEGGAVIDLASGEASPWGIALDGTYAYYSTTTMMKRVLQAGGTAPELIRGGLATPRKVVIGNGRAYWLYETGTGTNPTVESILLTGGGSQCHFNNQVSPHGLAVDATSIFHTLHVASPDGAIRKKPLTETCSTNAKVLASGLALPFELAVDASDVYWTVDQPNGSIMARDKSDTSTAQPRELATGQSSPWGIVVNPTNGTLYWTNGADDGAVMVLVR